jgi:hypothetical protein
MRLHADLTASIDEGSPLQSAELLGAIRTKARASKAVFVDFDSGVPWHEVVTMVDTVRSLADDPSHDEVTVAVRIHETP